MNEDENRRAFEAWVKAPPYERNVARSSARPGNYHDIAVQLAWEAWCERDKLAGPVAMEERTKAMLRLIKVA